MRPLKSSIKILFLCVIPVSIMNSCKSSHKFELLEINELRDVPSASGIEYTNSGIYVVGDDSPWLFRLNEELEIDSKFRLFPNRALPDHIYEKSFKPDLEAMTGTGILKEELYLFGSGSKSPARDVLVVVNPGKEHEIREYSLTEFYAELRSSANISASELNIEAAEVVGDHLYLFNRGANLILKYSLKAFRAYINGSGKVPVPEVFIFNLPQIKGITAGFSGASFAVEAEAFILTATVEDTSNWIDDGEILGSLVGMLKLSGLKDPNPQFVFIEQNEKVLNIKVESVTVVPPYSKNTVEILMVTDSDGGTSQILRGRLSLKN